MDTKLLYLVAVVVAAMSGGYYYYSGKAQKLDVNAAKNMTYTAKEVHVTQTDEQGNLYIRAEVGQLQQDMQRKTSQLDQLHAVSYKHGKVDATFTAQQAKGYNDHQKIVLMGNVVATKILPQGQMQFYTDELTSYPKTKQLETQHSVTVQTPTAQFVSQGLQANLNHGQYEFFKIRGKYVPSS